MASYEAVRIVEVVKDEREQLKYQLKFDELKKIFDAVQSVPVAIVSIAGAYRGGKSFMLTLLADYLLQDPWEVWGNDKKKQLTKVFDHRGGIDGNTNGIYVIQKPFIMKTKEEKEVAVFLMDTQGMFDKQSSANDNSVIFALSTLLSSVQIYNISGIIKENDLQHLQFFTDYAHCVTNKKGNVSTSSRNNPSDHPFQELLFLCRNWEQPDYDDGFQGGSKYLSDVMEVDNEENKLVRQRLADSFSHVSCSLMPHPGKSIAKRGLKDSKAVCFSDMDVDFISEVVALAKHLFDKDHLVAKKLNGRELTGEDFINLAMDYVGILHSGEIPQIETLVKRNEKVEFLLRVKDIESNYKKSMQAKMGEMPLVPEELEALHLQCLSEAKDLFQMHDILEDEAERQKYQWEMERNIGIICEAVSKDNEAKITRIMRIIDEHIIYAGRVYYESLEQFAADCWVEDIRKAEDRAIQKANETFNARMNDVERQWFGENECKALQSKFESKQKQFENKNASRKEELDRNISRLFMEAKHKYQDGMEVAVQQRNHDLEKAHEKSLSCALAWFNESNTGRYTNYKNEKELELKQELSEELKKYQKLYEKTMDDDLKKVLKQAKKKYLQHFQGMDQYVTETELESSHVKAEKMAMEVVNAVSDRGDHFVRKCKEKVAELIHFEKQHWVSRNELLKNILDSLLLHSKKNEADRLTRKRICLEDQYESEYTDFHETYVDDAKLQKMHDKALQRAITGLSHYETKHTEALETNREELEKRILDTFQMVKQTNVKNRKLICNKLLTFQTLLEADFSQKLYEVSRKRYAKIDDLENVHTGFKAAVKREVESLIPFPDIYEETIQLSFENVDKQFQKFVREYGEFWKEYSDNLTSAAMRVSLMLGKNYPLLALAVEGVTTFCGIVMTSLTSFNEDIDVSKLKSIIYLKELNL